MRPAMPVLSIRDAVLTVSAQSSHRTVGNKDERQFCPVCLCSFFASHWLTVLPLLVGAQLWSLVVLLVLFVLFHALLLLAACVPLFPFCMLLVFA
jgi:hypothetical protein